MADLLITPVNQEDYNNNFTLIAINAVGYEVYKIKIFSYED